MNALVIILIVLVIVAAWALLGLAVGIPLGRWLRRRTAEADE